MGNSFSLKGAAEKTKKYMYIHGIIKVNFQNILTNIVLPFPGGPYNSKPRAGALRPVNNYNKIIRFRVQL